MIRKSACRGQTSVELSTLKAKKVRNFDSYTSLASQELVFFSKVVDMFKTKRH